MNGDLAFAIDALCKGQFLFAAVLMQVGKQGLAMLTQRIPQFLSKETQISNVAVR
jgi:hypothetical protein